MSVAGSLDAEAVNALPYDKLGRLIVAVLRSRFGPAGVVPEELPHRTLLRLYRKLDPSVRQAFRDILREHLAALSQQRRSPWRSEAGDELLLLATDVFEDGFQAGQVIELLRYIVLTRDDLRNAKPNLHLRAAQSLLGLGYRGDSRFWIDLLSRTGPEYAIIVFAGMARLSISDAFEWLQSTTLPPEAFSAVLTMMPSLIEDHGTEKLASYLMQIYPFVPPEYADAFRAVASELHVPYLSHVLMRLDDAELRSLARGIDINMLLVGKSMQEIAWVLEQRLRKFSRNYLEYKLANPDIEIISCLSEFVGRNPHNLTPELRQKLHEIGVALVSAISCRPDFNKYMIELNSLIEADQPLRESLEAYILKLDAS